MTRCRIARGRPANRRGGFAILVSLVALLLLATATALLAAVLGMEQREVLRERERIDLQALNDGAIAASLAELAADPYGREITPERRFENGAVVRSQLVRVGENRARLITTAHLGGRTLRTEIVLRESGERFVPLSWQRLPASSPSGSPP